MKTSIKICGLVAAMMIAATGSALAAPTNSVYVHATDGSIVKSGTGLCWRTGYWTPALAEATNIDEARECDADLVKAPAAAPAPAPQPAPQPAPVAAPEPAPAHVARITLAADMLFAFNKAELSKEGKSVLDELVTQLAGVNVEAFLATGYTDRIGSDQYNLKLSERRAEAVKKYLVSRGLPDSVIQTEGKGKADPVVDCPNPAKGTAIKNRAQLIECLAPNRRAVVEVQGVRAI